MRLSTLGIFHTVIGVIALLAALVSYVRYGKINIGKLSGSIYLYLTLVTSLTALGLSRLGGFNPGHVFSLFIVVIVLIAAFLHYRKKSGVRARYWENFLLSLSVFLSLVPTINETLTRVPVSHPLASGPTDPLVGKTLLLIFLLFVTGSVYQFIKLKRVNKRA